MIRKFRSILFYAIESVFRICQFNIFVCYFTQIQDWLSEEKRYPR